MAEMAKRDRRGSALVRMELLPVDVQAQKKVEKKV